MQDLMQPLIHKAQLTDLRVNVRKSGICLGDPVRLFSLDDGQIGVFAERRWRLFGLFRRSTQIRIGTLGPAASALLADTVKDAGHLRLRIVGLTPEHLAASGQAEVFISVWGNADPQLTVIPAAAE